jgi:hypothetical protein
MIESKYDIFISHSSNDAQLAFILCEALEQEDLICWIAPRNVKMGFPYAKSIVEGIEKSKALVVLFSNNANESTGVLKEIEIANNSKIPIITLRIEDVFPTKSMKFYILANHWLDAINPKSIDDFEVFVKEIKTTINPNNIDIPVNIMLKPINSEKKNHTITAIFMPFIFSFILLSTLSHILYPSLEPKDTVYSFLVLSFIFAKIFIFFRRKFRR